MPLVPGMNMSSYPPAIAVTLFYRAFLMTGVAVALSWLA